MGDIEKSDDLIPYDRVEEEYVPVMANIDSIDGKVDTPASPPQATYNDYGMGAGMDDEEEVEVDNHMEMEANIVLGAGYPTAPLRSGKWSPEEEIFANQLIKEFKEGTLPISEGLTLRTFLAKVLHCEPMRISKKFAGMNSIGKLAFKIGIVTAEEIQHHDGGEDGMGDTVVTRTVIQPVEPRISDALSEMQKNFLDKVHLSLTDSRLPEVLILNSSGASSSTSESAFSSTGAVARTSGRNVHNSSSSSGKDSCTGGDLMGMGGADFPGSKPLGLGLGRGLTVRTGSSRGSSATGKSTTSTTTIISGAEPRRSGRTAGKERHPYGVQHLYGSGDDEDGSLGRNSRRVRQRQRHRQRPNANFNGTDTAVNANLYIDTENGEGLIRSSSLEMLAQSDDSRHGDDDYGSNPAEDDDFCGPQTLTTTQSVTDLLSLNIPGLGKRSSFLSHSFSMDNSLPLPPDFNGDLSCTVIRYPPPSMTENVANPLSRKRHRGKPTSSTEALSNLVNRQRTEAAAAAAAAGTNFEVKDHDMGSVGGDMLRSDTDNNSNNYSSSSSSSGSSKNISNNIDHIDSSNDYNNVGSDDSGSNRDERDEGDEGQVEIGMPYDETSNSNPPEDRLEAVHKEGDGSRGFREPMEPGTGLSTISSSRPYGTSAITGININVSTSTSTSTTISAGWRPTPSVENFFELVNKGHIIPPDTNVLSQAAIVSTDLNGEGINSPREAHDSSLSISSSSSS